MKKIIPLIIALSLAGLGGASAQSTAFRTINQTNMNLGFYWWSTNPSFGPSVVSGNPGLSTSLGTLVADYTTPSSVTLSPTTAAGLTNISWYSPFVTPGPGSTGNQTIVSYLFGQSINLNTSFNSIEFSGDVTDFSLGTNIAGTPYTLAAVIRDIPLSGPGVNTTTVLPLTTEGFFSMSHSIESGTNRAVQWGLMLTGPNIWPTDSAQQEFAGSVTVVPEPSTYALLGLAAVGGLIARRFRRKA
jgi:hypothetical protein